jgi:hypothetical protein
MVWQPRSQITVAEKRRRKLQSDKDKAANSKLPPITSQKGANSNGRKAQNRASGSAIVPAPKSKSGTRNQPVMRRLPLIDELAKSIGKGYPSTIPTRIEYIRSYVRFRIPQKTAYHPASMPNASGVTLIHSGQAAGKAPIIMWHPGESICHILGIKDADATSGMVMRDFWRHSNRDLVAEQGNPHHTGSSHEPHSTHGVGTAGEASSAKPGEHSADPTPPSNSTASAGLNFWTNDGVESHQHGYASTVTATKSWDETLAPAAAVEGYPGVVVTRSARVIGGMMRVTVSGGNSTSGLMRYATFPGEACVMPMSEIKKQMLHQTTKRMEMPRGRTVSKYFSAPLNNPTQLGERQAFRDYWSWGKDDPFGSLCVMFQDIDFGAMDQEPICELSSVVTLELPLMPDLRHLRTSHAKEDVLEKRRVHNKVGESGEVSAGWDIASKFGMGMAEDAGKAAGTVLKGMAEKVFSGGVVADLPAIA